MTWDVGGNVVNPGTINSSGLFETVNSAPNSGDCFVIATDVGRGLVDTIGILIQEECLDDIVLQEGGVDIAEGDCVYISDLPAMPQLTASFGNVLNTGLVDWTLDITYNRSLRNDFEQYQITLPHDAVWSVFDAFGTDFRGGEALLQASPQGLNCVTTFSFSIRAFNPSEIAAQSYIDATGNMWYDKRVAKHESGTQLGRSYLQFNEIETLQCNSLDVRYTPNATVPLPNDPNPKFGFGIYQLTFIPGPPTEQELWNWQTNVESGVGWLVVKQGGANTAMLGYRIQANNDNGGIDVPVPDTTIGNVFFSDNSSIIMEHANGLKRYNGLGGTAPEWEYCSWSSQLQVWVFNGLNNFGFDYVTNICNTNP